MLKLAICIYGTSDQFDHVKFNDLNERCTAMFSGDFTISVFQNFDYTDRYKNLWLVSQMKKQVEIESLSRFDVCLAIEIGYDMIELPTRLMVNPCTLYCRYSGQLDPNMFFADSMTFDRTAEFYHKQLPKLYESATESKFEYHVRSYLIKPGMYHA